MANRAYLYAVDSIDESAWVHQEFSYYDSRWTIPLAWFFFFSPEDIFRRECGWWELKLVANKGAAVSRFRSRIPQMREIVRHSDHDLLEPFVHRVASRPGEFLVLEPVEIVQDDDAALPEWTDLLHRIENRDVDSKPFRERLIQWSRYPGVDLRYPDAAELTLIGYTYLDDTLD